MKAGHASSRADLLRALALLEPADEWTRREIARLLGWAPKSSSLDASSPTTSNDKDREPSVPDEAQGPETDSSMGSAPLTPVDHGATELESRIVVGATPEVSELNWLDDVEPLERMAPKLETLADWPTLFPPDKTRGLLTALLTDIVRLGPIDLDRIVETISRGEDLAFVPRRPCVRFAKHVQVMIDVNEGMAPFREDVSAFVSRLQAIGDSHKVSVLRFNGSPLLAGKKSRRTWSSYTAAHTPPAGTRVVCLTDLGIGRALATCDSPEQEDWLEFRAHLKRADVSFVAVVPHDPDRWPETLRKHLDLVRWSRSTNAAEVVRAVRHRPKGVSRRW